ncbi:HAD-IIB family hydrolase [Hamadaea sp. NPDC051192]|uniref:HAD-IIB family hydrolase n=1 Tax=Hamadaea sp. NPDC051192 TaxID=3154940 RepID=UPI003435FDE9
MIVSDLDATLLRSDFTISNDTLAVLSRVHELNIPFVIATGRALGTWQPMIQRLPVRDPVITANGALITKPGSYDPLAEWPLSPSDLADAIGRLRATHGDVTCGVERGIELLHEPGYRPATWVPNRITRQVSTRELVAEPAHLLRIQSRTTDLTTVATVNDLRLSVTLSSATSAEAVADTVSKATAAAWLTHHYGIAATEVLAFGDFTNDVALLKWAGHGVAVGNACDDAITAADEVTASCDDDGVARYLRPIIERTADDRRN